MCSFWTLAGLLMNGHSEPSRNCWITVRQLREARATLIKIEALLQNGLRVLRVEDNGTGMRGVALKGMLDFGKTEFSAERIGCYGMGSKSGMMRLASDALILSAREGTLAVDMLSRSFHRSHELNKVTSMPLELMNTECKLVL